MRHILFTPPSSRPATGAAVFLLVTTYALIYAALVWLAPVIGSAQ